MGRRVGAIGVVAALTIAACGGSDDVDSRDANAPADANTDDEPVAGADSGSESDSESPDDQADASSSDSTSPVTTGDSTPTSVPVPEPGELIGPPPDTDAMSPADGPPGPEFALFQASAKVSAGGSTIDLTGLDTLWFTEFNASGKPIWDSYSEQFSDGRDLESNFADVLVAGCSIILPSSGGVAAQASFRHRTDREGHSSFSMSDNADGTVIWGLYIAATKEEWSATGEGSATVRYLKYTSADESEDRGFDTTLRDALGLKPRTEDVYMVIEFAGEASENFSTEKSDASSTVICQYVVPIS